MIRIGGMGDSAIPVNVSNKTVKLMKVIKLYWILSLIVLAGFTLSCRSTKKIQTAINKKDTSSVIITSRSSDDSLLMMSRTVDSLHKSNIDFKTFAAKIKVEYVDNSGKQSNVTAYVHVMKDSLIWVSMYATIFNIEAFRILITKDSVTVVDKINKEVQFRSLNYLQDVTEIPFDFKTLQDLIVGNAVYMDGDVISFRQSDDKTLLSISGKYFKHLLTLTNSGRLIHSKLDDVDIDRHRTADITYGDYVPVFGSYNFSTYREITVSEKNKLDIRLNFKQYDFNKELSNSFNIPKNYKKRR